MSQMLNYDQIGTSPLEDISHFGIQWSYAGLLNNPVYHCYEQCDCPYFKFHDILIADFFGKYTISCC